jgi:short-subunit dehydrogenase
MKNIQMKRWRERYGPWAVVTGASSGIGREIALELSVIGLDLVLVARSEEALQQLAAEIVQRGRGGQVRVIVADLAETSGVKAVEVTTRPLDVGLLVAAAGFGTSGAFLDATQEEEVSLLDVNCRAVLMQSLHFGRRLAERGRGGLILFGSLVGFQGAPWAANYAASKAYVQSLGEALHVELGPRGVDVLVSAPGPVRSGFGERARMKMGAAETPATVARATVKALGWRMTVTPGRLSKFLTWSLMTAPRGLRVRIMSKIMGGMARQ